MARSAEEQLVGEVAAALHRSRLVPGVLDALLDPRRRRRRRPGRRRWSRTRARSCGCSGRCARPARQDARSAASAPSLSPARLRHERISRAASGQVELRLAMNELVRDCEVSSSMLCASSWLRCCACCLRLADVLVDLADRLLGRVEDRPDDEDPDRRKDRHGGDDLDDRVDDGACTDHEFPSVSAERVAIYALCAAGRRRWARTPISSAQWRRTPRS